MSVRTGRERNIDTGPTWQAALLFLLLVLAAARFSLRLFAHGQLGILDPDSLYQGATLAFNYFQFGSVRRGLGGSFAYLMSSDPGIATNLFHVASTIGVAAAAALLFRASGSKGVLRLAFALTMIVIMLRWGEDRGRTDMAVTALLGFSTIAFMRGRAALAAALVGIGLFVHESSFVFGLPLLAALILRSGWRNLTPSDRIGILGTLAIALLIYLGLGALPHASRLEMVGVIRSRFPQHDYVDWAMYFALSGMRGVKASMCQNMNDPTYWTHPLTGLILIAVMCAALLAARSRSLGWGLIAAIPGFVFLCVVANDMSRWAMFACFNVWLIGISSADEPRDRAGLRMALAVLFVPLVLYHANTSVPLRIYSPSPALEAVVRRLGGPPTPPVSDALSRCDPHWRDVLNVP